MSVRHKINWKKVHELNDKRIMEQLKEQYMEKNFKEVKKLFIHDMREFKFGIGYFISTWILITATILLIINNACPVLYIISGVVALIPAALCVTTIIESLSYVTVKVPLTDADKLLGD